MAFNLCYFIVCILFYFIDRVNCDILCEAGFCSSYRDEVGCISPVVNCRANNATHKGIWLPSPTLCNCCEYCLPLYGENHHCSLGGPGTGTTVGRCGDGLTCEAASSGGSFCTRMDTECHRAQDDYDDRYTRGETGVLEERPNCDGKGNYSTFSCIPTQTCFCQSEAGERLFGEVLYLGTHTKQNMHCGCSRFHERMRRSISPGVRLPVIGPRCTSDGNFNPIQCVNNMCYCVDTITGEILHGHGKMKIDLNEEPIANLTCYNRNLDLFPEQSTGEPPYNYTTPCFNKMNETINLILKSEKDGYNMDYFNTIPECLPDGTYGRIARTRNGTKICVDDRGHQIDGYEALPYTPEYNSMNCKCAETSLVMSKSTEKPVCCKNGNFRRIQCRRGLCRCVDSDGRQDGPDAADVTTLKCYTSDWRDC
ncbi:uncharacterized protein LOC113510491 [Galleria mellonella]|uniref:Uncharacterized protein LOC113510491 n=1 Tax=Galleria mellonella TaxID=7137 RepID=A0ABM3MSH2_GALME|nr:uncharacterized protein LOC113510491 [Galleria mellonella]